MAEYQAQIRSGKAITPNVGRRAFYVDQKDGRYLLCDPDARLTQGCRLVAEMDGEWLVATSKTKHPERAKWIRLDFSGAALRGFKRSHLARVVGIMQSLL